jgi:hypothetical protein
MRRFEGQHLFEELRRSLEGGVEVLPFFECCVMHA